MITGSILRRSLAWLTMVAAPMAAAPASAAPTGVPAPYSIPWQLRPAAPVTVLRLESAIATYADAGGRRGVTGATMVLGSFKLHPDLATFVRLGLVGNEPPAAPMSPGGAASFANPIVGFTWGRKLPRDFRIALILAMTLPMGTGAGNHPDPAQAAANRAGVAARSSMDNAMFAVNDFALIPGIDVAWMARGVTIQLEATLFQLFRVRGPDAQKDAFRTNFTAGLHVGYFVLPQLSFGAEVRCQVWLSTPAAVAADPTGASRETVSFAVGARGHFRSGSVWIRPGIAYATGLDAPMLTQQYHIVQIDLPILF